MKKILLYLTLFTFFVFAGTSCKKALDVADYGFYSQDDILTSASDAVSLLVGAYSELTTDGDYNLMPQPYWMAIDLDNDHVSGPSWLMGNIGSGNFADFWGMNRLWAGFYTTIERCNTVLLDVPGMQIDTAVRNDVVGEAYALRAWSYFNLVQLYGSVPLRLQTNGTVVANLAPSSVSTIYNQIVSDLNTAIKLLYEKNNTKFGGVGRISKSAARTLLAKVYLTMASGAQSGISISVRGGTDNKVYNYTETGVTGYSGFDSKTYFTLAKNEADTVIQSGLYTLQPSYADIFKKANIKGTEAIWYLQGKDAVCYNQLNMYYSPCSTVRGYGGWIYLSNNFYDSYDSTDSRALDEVYHQNYYVQYGSYPTPAFYPERDSSKYAYSASVTYNSKTWTQQAIYLPYAYLKKYSDVSSPDASNSDATVFLLRYADLFLIYAEAENEVNGPTTAAYDALNKIRSRSNAPLAPAGMSQTDFRSYVIEERAREFPQETNRRFDLIRRGIYIGVMSQIGVDQQNNIKTRTKKHLLFPVPQTELDANKLMVQNQGW